MTTSGLYEMLKNSNQVIDWCVGREIISNINTAGSQTER
jgi:hypothetical protein